MTVVDTSVWIDALQGRSHAEADWLNLHLSEPEIALTDLIVCEVLQGARLGSTFEDFRRDLLQLPVLETGGINLAVDSARHYAWLRARGITVRSTIDCLIATFCIREGHALLHRDRDFDPFERHLGLQVVHP